MIITNANTGQKAEYSLDGDVLTVGDVSIDLEQKQRATENVINVCLDNQLETMREGMGAWYVANVIIPSKQYTLEKTGERNEDGEETTKEVQLPVDTSQVELRLWALPAQYFENQAENTEGDEV